MNQITELIRKDPVRVEALKLVAQLSLPECYIAAGFVRNLVWDHIHYKSCPTQLNDIDVVYFDRSDNGTNSFLQYENHLKGQMISVNWQVRNQALMHIRNGDKPYMSTIDAMSYWPEKETAVGIRLLSDGNYECVSAFGFNSLFSGHITHNPKRSLEIFNNRVNSKDWLVKWPALRVAL